MNSLNIKSEQNLFSYCKKIKISKIFYFSTIKVYGEDFKYGALDELATCNPITDYAKKKIVNRK